MKVELLTSFSISIEIIVFIVMLLLIIAMLIVNSMFYSLPRLLISSVIILSVLGLSIDIGYKYYKTQQENLKILKPDVESTYNIALKDSSYRKISNAFIIKNESITKLETIDDENIFFSLEKSNLTIYTDKGPGKYNEVSKLMPGVIY